MAALLAAFVAFSSQVAKAQSTKDGSVGVRRELLRDYLEPRRGNAAVAPYFPAIFGAVTLGVGVGVAIGGVGEDPSGRSRWVFAGTYTAASAMSFGAYAVSVDYRSTAVEGALGLLIIGTGAGFYVSSRATDTIQFSTAAIIGTGLVYEGLVITDAALLRPISSTRLVGHLNRLERDGPITDRELARIERDFGRTVRPIPPWVFSLTFGLGGLVAASPIFFEGTSKDDKAASLVFANVLLVPALGSIVPIITGDRNNYTAYERALRKVRLSPLGPAGSAGLTLSGTF